MSKIILETSRLILREFSIDDTPFIIELLNTQGWLQFIGDRNVKNEEQASKYLENGPLKSYKTHGYGLWKVELKDNHTAIGMCGLINRDYLEHPDIGFAFLPEYNGKGYGLEIASATLQHANVKLNIPVIAAITNMDNEKSIRLLEKLGMSKRKTIRIPGEETDLLYFTI